jgi:hypothetical protein
MKKQRADYVDPTRSISHIPSQWNRSNTAMKRMLELSKPIPVERHRWRLLGCVAAKRAAEE